MQAVRNSIAATLGRPLVLREKIAVRSYLRDHVFADVDNNADETSPEDSSNSTNATEDEGLAALLKVRCARKNLKEERHIPVRYIHISVHERDEYCMACLHQAKRAAGTISEEELSQMMKVPLSRASQRVPQNTHLATLGSATASMANSTIHEEVAEDTEPEDEFDRISDMAHAVSVRLFDCWRTES